MKFEYYGSFLQVSQFENKIKYIEKNRANVKGPMENHKHFIKNNKLISKPQENLKSKMHNVFTEEINKIALSSNDEKNCN